uniref:Uncharacterized protein n=1 Tax=uncultured Thiotrichaceae bacterium TaxID=298394 RepID=A0A6S6TEL7_9GAMM|nr:MAG: Unknown protein [uncultured Thiotrichaceae bacterium]
MNAETRRLWIALIVITFLLALNAVTTILGWSPFAAIVQEQIEERSHAADIRSKAQRDELRLEQVQPQPESSTVAGKHKKQPEKVAPSAVGNESDRPLKPVALKSPVAPRPPVAPQTPPPPLAPVPPVYIVPPIYMMYYSDGSVRYIIQPVYPTPAR